jgi:hypothetical protein
LENGKNSDKYYLRYKNSLPPQNLDWQEREVYLKRRSLDERGLFRLSNTEKQANEKK